MKMLLAFRNRPYATLLFLLPFLAACGTLQLGIERTSTPDPHLNATAITLATQSGSLATPVVNTPTLPVTNTPTVTAIATAAITPTETPTLTPTRTPAPAACVPHSTFVTDVTIPDGTAVEPGKPFVKTWRVSNSGTCSWDGTYAIAFVQGELLGAPSLAPIPVAAPGVTVDISLQLVAPSTSGRYQGTWRLRAPDGTSFGTNLIVDISVSGPTPTVTLTPTRDGSLACPAEFAGYPDTIAAYLNDPGATLSGLAIWLKGCGVITDNLGGVYEYTLQGGPTPDALVVIHDMVGAVGPEGMLLAYHASPNGYSLAYQAQAERIELLKVEDVNADSRPEIVWTSTSCGAHTCFSQLFVDRWNGEGYQGWIVGTPEMASADYTLADTVPDGSGQEILVHGGTIGSVGAGPQRAWTETYISPGGGPYELFSKVYDPSNCLYHHILDANERFNQGAVNGYGPAISAYQAAISDPNLEACHHGDLPDELVTLRDFGRFRLVVAYAAEGQLPQAESIRAQISSPALLGAADAFLSSYNTSGNLAQACADTTAYSVANPDSWQYLADWGYANPTFAAEDLCPIR
jgi:hypothetical protein